LHGLNGVFTELVHGKILPEQGLCFHLPGTEFIHKKTVNLSKPSSYF
jgi:hypothetical protein